MASVTIDVLVPSMVTALFLLALVSFAAMGSFVVGLTVYSSLRTRAERADLARDALIALFASRQALIPELEALASGHGGDAGAAPHPPRPPAVGDASASADLEQWGAHDRALRVFAGDVLERAAHQPDRSPRSAELRRRLGDSERAIGDALRAYNSAATEFNDARALVPAAFVARVSGMGARRPLVLTN